MHSEIYLPDMSIYFEIESKIEKFQKYFKDYFSNNMQQ